ncbi:hypothetical protein V8G54_002673 [Vigna mungo]|uniref:SWIM-type domain-containing protein n=1 Tax=Vigna mungo TaxID=3915 RepID=A0AAQ3S9F6_VIGMU
MGYTTSYRKAWLAKQHAIEHVYGNWEESFNKLPCLLLKTQPIIDGQEARKNQQYFKRLFWTFKPCVDGFPYCKPLVQVNGTFLYGRYKGTLLVAVAQDGRNNILPIAFAIVEGETADAWFFFLKNLRRHVTPQQNLCLILDRHNSISAAFNRPTSGWTEGQCVHVYCIRHIAQNFTRRFRDTSLKKDLVNMAYAMTEPRCNYYYNIIRENNPEAAAWIDQIPRQQFTLAYDEGRRWGHLTTNLAKAINSVLKKIRNLPISSIVLATYTRCNAFFTERGKQITAMISVGHIYSENATKVLQDGDLKSNTHRVIEFDRNTTRFRVEEMVNPREIRPAGKFVVRLYERWCDCGKFQKIHLPCSHVLVACKHAHHDFNIYISPYYRLDVIMKVYNNLFGELRHEEYWPPYQGTEIWPHPATKRNGKGRPKSSRIRTEMDIREQLYPRNCSYCQTPGHTRNRCPHNPGMRGSTSHH